MNIRPEKVQDYAAIAEVNIRAFDERLAEALIVTLHRQRPQFDPELSLVAEIDGEIVGHVLFSPQTIRLMGQDVKAVNLAPIAVDPAHQRKGIGAALIQVGHEIAQSKGYVLSFLLGHPTYYPRLGYRTHVYGEASVSVPIQPLPAVGGINANLPTRTPVQKDISVLQQLWRHEENNVDFAIVPGDSLADWLSPSQLIQARVYLHYDRVVGYTRIKTTEPGRPLLFLAQDAHIAQLMAADIGRGLPSITLPIHPYSASASAFSGAVVKAWDAGMAYPLTPSPFDEFYARLQAGERLAGRPVWPSAFDVE